MAKPLKIEWDLYEQGSIPAKRLVLYRGEGGGELTPYRVFTNLTRTQFRDADTQKGQEYCYEITAVTSSGVSSLPSSRKCATPRK